jgi:hypothetical protein
MTTTKHIIWSNINLNLDDWRADILSEKPGLSEDEMYEIMHETNNDYLCDERINLNIELPDSIIVFGDIGRWNGRVSGYKDLGSNINKCLYSDECDLAEWYVDENGDLRFTGHHHDGTNHYLYRMFRPEISNWDRDKFRDEIYNRTCTQKDISRFTVRLGDLIGDVYGWSYRGRRPKCFAKAFA